MIRRAFPLYAAAFAACLSVPAVRAADGYSGVPLFQTPGVAAAQDRVNDFLAARRYDAATQLLTQLSRNFPEAGHLHVARAQLAAALNDPDTAAKELAAAIADGFTELDRILLVRPMNAFADRPEFLALRQLPAGPKPTPHEPRPGIVTESVALVTEDNSKWDGEIDRIRVDFNFPPRMSRLPIERGSGDPAAERLQKLVSRGAAAGNVGDFYDNRDNGHSVPHRGGPTQISHIAYTSAAKTAQLDVGINTAFLFNGPTIGNSSTFMKERGWRSWPSASMTNPHRAEALAQLYENNHLYVFPAKTDYWEREPDRIGDTYAAAAPFFIASQGHSLGDLPHVKALRYILAALPAESKRKLRDAGALAAAMQQIYRRAYLGAGAAEEAYLTAAAHPSVFLREKIDLMRIIDLAQATTPDRMPPVARLEVVEENRETGAFRSPLSEVLFTTPYAVARAWRGLSAERRYVLSAESSTDIDGKPLSFHWKVLRGDADRIQIRKLDDSGARVEVVIPWHDETRTGDGLNLRSHRIDIALFAHNGAAYSAPAFFSQAFPHFQTREYRQTNAGPLPVKIDFRNTHGGHTSFDHAIWTQSLWKDAYRYDDQNRLLGWTREYVQGPPAEYTVHGLKVTLTDAQGRPVLAEAISYRLEPGSNDETPGHVVEAPTGRMFSYEYESDDQMMAEPRPVGG